MEELNKKISGIRAMMKDMKAEVYAIVNPELAALEEYTKNLYLKVLCTIVQYENEPSEMQVLYLKRIAAGIKVEEPLEEYMRKALEISDIDIQEFISFMKENRVRYYFALESMLLVALGDSKQQNYEYLAELIELSGVTKCDLDYLSLIAKSVLQQDSNYYEEAKNVISEGTRELNFNPYIINFYVGAIVDSDIEKYYSAPSLGMKCDVVLPTEYTARKITFKNLVLDLQESWSFTGCEKVEFINCRLSTKKSAVIYFKAVGNVVFNECEILNFDNRVSSFDAVDEVVVRKCFLCNCGWTCSGDKKGGLFIFSNFKNAGMFVFENSKVQNCYIKNRKDGYYGVTGILFDAYGNCHIKYKILNNEFIGCRCINNNNSSYTDAIISGISGKSTNVTSSNNKATGGVTRLFEDEK